VTGGRRKVVTSKINWKREVRNRRDFAVRGEQKVRQLRS
jgi:hypothetical protein